MKTEHIEQSIFVNYVRNKYTNLLIFAIPNGGMRHPVEALKLKHEGVVPGIPDLFVPELKLFIEMKREIGHFKKYQREISEQLQKSGYLFFVGYGYVDAIQKFEKIIEKVKYSENIQTDEN